MADISRISPVPLYYQIEETIKKMIDNGELKAGDFIPTDEELCSQYGVSRITVRTAIQLLVDQGYLYKQQGKRTTVLGRQLKRDAMSLSGFSQDAAQNNKRAGSVTLSLKYQTPPSWVSSAMKLDTNIKLIELSRLRTINEDPIAIQICYLSPHLNIEIDELKDIDSLYKFLRNSKGIRIVQGEEFVKAAIVPKEFAANLGINTSDAVLVIRRTTYDDTGMPIECVEGYYCSDRYSHYSLVKSDSSSGSFIR